MAKVELKVGDLIQWGVPGFDNKEEIGMVPQPAMVIDFEYDIDGAGIAIPSWIAMRGDGTKWALTPSRGYRGPNRGKWWDISQIGGTARVRTSPNFI